MAQSTDHPVNPGSFWLFPTTLFFWIVIVAISFFRYGGTPVQPKDAPADQFSAERALVILDDLVGDGITHPSGSEQITVVRKKIIQRLEGYGYQVQSHPCTATSRGEEYSLVNLFTRLKGKNHGTADQRVIAVVTHYDSRAPSPGAGDDGAGLSAAIEVARMLKSLPQLNHDILFLITDGEEMGLLGAREFVKEQKDLMKQISVVVNLEARGSSGPSLMFETHPDNAVSVRQFQAASPKPFCGSLFYEIYKRLPNDTDFTIFKKENLPGFNFAFIGDVENYHAASDSIQNLDMRSMQHHGDNLLSLLFELDQWNKFQPDEEETKFHVYFDVMGWFVVHWPSHWSIILWVLATSGWLVVVWTLRKPLPNVSTEVPDSNENSNQVPAWVTWFNQSLWVRSGFWCLGMALACSMALFAMHAGLLSGEALQRGWVNDALAVEVAYWAVAICAIYVCVWLSEQSEIDHLVWFWVLLFWSLVGLVVTINVAGACYLFIVPLLVTAAVALVPAFLLKRSFHPWCYFVFAVAVGLLWLPMERMFYDAIGFRINLFLILRIAFVTTTLFPIAFATPDKWVPRIAVSMAFLGFGASIFSVVWT